MRAHRLSTWSGGTIGLLPVLLAALSCGPAFQPRQAQFDLQPCASPGEEFNPAALEWNVHPGAVLQRGAPGEWDSVDVLNPSVVLVAGTLLNFYSGFDGRTWHTGLATSPDGLSWQKQGRVLSPDPAGWEGAYIAANGSAAHDGQRFLYWYQAGERGATRIAFASSSDGKDWRKHPEPVLWPGATGTWDEAAVGDPYVFSCSGIHYLFYLGQNRRGLQRLGVARSSDGIHWQKSSQNPILEVGPPGSFDEKGLGEPAVFHAGQFYMLYAGRDSGERRRIAWARSRNGVDWEKTAGAALFNGPEPWNAAVVCDPSILRLDHRWWVWFGGGDRPSPDENLNGEIGLAWIEPSQDTGQ
jgi:predicted GH43/DUF377 family glycosyl hydrolase